MSVDVSIPIYGVKEAIKELKEIDPALRRQLTKDYGKIAKPVIDEIKSTLPKTAPLSGMRRQWVTKSGFQMFPFQDGYVQKVSARINTKNIREFNGFKSNVGTFVIKYVGAVGVVLDMAANGRLGQALTARIGTRSRYVYPAWAKNEDVVNTAMANLVEDVMKQVNRKVVQ
jgi:hypothetical protein